MSRQTLVDDRLLETLNEQAEHIATLQRLVKSLIERVEDRAQRLKAEEKEGQERDQRIKIIEDYLRSLGPMQAAGGPELFPDRSKRTIKGGWVNVYNFDKPWIGCIFATRAQADAERAGGRKACIQIPDITEGEGL